MKLRLAILMVPLLILSACKEKKTEVLSDVYLSKTDAPVNLVTAKEEVNDLFRTIELKEKTGSFPVQVFTDEEGNVEKINIMDQPNEQVRSVSAKIAQAFSKIKFKPASLNGKKVKAQFLVNLHAVPSKDSGVKWSISFKENPETPADYKFSSNLPPNLKEEDFLISTEIMPEPVGGIAAIGQKIVYPEIAKRAGIEGKVMVSAFIDEQGNVIHTSVIKGIGQNVGMDEAAMEAVHQTKFKPAMHDGKPVKVKIVVPIMFKLQ